MEGAFLASPWFLEFTKVIKEIQADRSELEKVYSGVQKTFAEGALTIVEGKMVISTHPSDLIDLELCEVFQADGSTGAVHCKEKLPFICYRPEETEDNDYPAEYFNVPTSNPKTQFSTEPALSQTLENDCGEENLGYEYSVITDHCYKFHAHAVYTWYDAKAACEQEGAYLAIINSDLEAQVLKKLFERYPAEKIEGAQFSDTAAIGYLRNEFDDWVTIDGDKLEVAGYEAWRPDAPHPRAKLGFLYRDGLLSGYVPAIRNVPYICEKPRVFSLRTEQEQSTTENELKQTTEQENYTSTTETDQEVDVEPKLDLSLTEASNCSAGYGFSKQTGHCYRFYAQAVHTWYDAKKACEEDDAYLAIINSYVEAEVLRTLFEQYPADKIYGAQYTDTAAIGFFKDMHSNWVTVHGEALEKAGYINWRPNGPHPWAQLGFIYRDGRLSAFVEAIRDEPYICEKEPSKQEYSSSTEAQTTVSNNEHTVEPNYDEYTSEPNYYDDPHYDEIREEKYDKPAVNQYYDEHVTVEPKLTELETEKTPDRETTSSYKKTSELALKKTNYCEGQGYEFFEQTGRCYKFHTQATKNKFTARITCLKEKAEIAVINSDVETLVIKTLLKNSPRDTIPDHFLIPRKMDGRRLTIDGDSLEEDDYDVWSDGETIYISIGSYGQHRAIDQNEYGVPFICEKRPIEQSSTTTEAEFAHIIEDEKLSKVTEKEIEPTTEKKLEETTMQPIDRSVVEMHLLKNIHDLEETIEDAVTHSTNDELPKKTEKEFEQTTQDRLIKTTQDESSLDTTMDELQTTEDGLPQPPERVIEQTSQNSKQKSEVEDAYNTYHMDSMVPQGKLNPKFLFDRFDKKSDDDYMIVNPFEGDDRLFIYS